MSEKIRNAVLDYISNHPDSTSDEAALSLGLEADAADVTACYLMQDGLIYQVGKRQIERGLRPFYRAR